MYSLVKSLGLQKALRQEGVPLLLSFGIAEMFYKLHSFALETLGFLATWYLISAVIGRVRNSISDR